MEEKKITPIRLPEIYEEHELCNADVLYEKGTKVDRTKPYDPNVKIEKGRFYFVSPKWRDQPILVYPESMFKLIRAFPKMKEHLLAYYEKAKLEMIAATGDGTSLKDWSVLVEERVLSKSEKNKVTLESSIYHGNPYLQLKRQTPPDDLQSEGKEKQWVYCRGATNFDLYNDDIKALKQFYQKCEQN